MSAQFHWSKRPEDGALLGVWPEERFPAEQIGVPNRYPLWDENLSKWQEHCATCGVSNKDPTVVLDLRNIGLLESASINQLVRLRKEVVQQGGTVHLIGLSKDIFKVFDILNLTKGYFGKVETAK